MEQKEILKEEECAAALDNTMFSTMESFEINGKVLLPSDDLAWRGRLSVGDQDWRCHRKSGVASQTPTNTFPECFNREFV